MTFTATCTGGQKLKLSTFESVNQWVGEEDEHEGTVYTGSIVPVEWEEDEDV